MMNQKIKNSLKIVGFGVLIYIVLLIVLFVVSMIFQTDKPFDLSGISQILAAVIVFLASSAASFLFSRLMKPESLKQAAVLGLAWAAILLLLMLVITVANGTQGIIFGNWAGYIWYVAVAIGPLFGRFPKKSEPENSSADIGTPANGR